MDCIKTFQKLEAFGKKEALETPLIWLEKT